MTARAPAALAGALALALAAGCTVVEDAQPAIDTYPEWHRLDNTGKIPGHGDTYRIIYVNDHARSYGGHGPYPLCSTIVKEIRRVRSDGTPGNLEYLAIMRKVRQDRSGPCRLSQPDGDRYQVPDDVALDNGWLFTIADELGADERPNARCWSTCHVQAPFDGTWFDYGQ